MLYPNVFYIFYILYYILNIILSSQIFLEQVQNLLPLTIFVEKTFCRPFQTSIAF